MHLFDALLYGPICCMFGMMARLAPANTSRLVTVTAVDLAAGIEVGESSRIEVKTIHPVVAVSVVELIEKGVVLSDLDDGTIEFNGKIWRIESHLLKPSPEGELAGEVYLALVDDLEWPKRRSRCQIAP